MSEKLKHTIYSSTECLSEQTMFDYIDNRLSPKERHIAEKHMLDCELCADAIEGLEMVSDRTRISVINKTINEFITPIAEKETKIVSFNYRTAFSIAAGIALLIGGVFFFNKFTLNETKSSDVAELKETSTPVESAPPPPPPISATQQETPNNAAASGESERVMETKLSPSKNKEGQLESDDELKQVVSTKDTKEQNTNGDFKSVIANEGAAQAPLTPGSSGTTYAWQNKENSPNRVKLDDAVAKQESDKAPVLIHAETEVSQPVLGGAADYNKNTTLDESKKAEEKKVTENTVNTTAPSYGYATNSPTPDQKQEQKNDKYKSDGDRIALAKKNETTGKTCEEVAKGKDKKNAGNIDANKADEDVAGKIAYEPPSDISVLDKEDAKTEPKTSSATTISTATVDNTSTDGLFYRANADSVNIYADSFAEIPKYPGGNSEMNKFIHKNFKYSKLTASDGTKIIVQFTVTKDGSTKNPKILKGINKDLNKEALRVIGLMPKFIPAKDQKGKPIDVDMNLPIQLEIK
jgi:hypothetical protein